MPRIAPEQWRPLSGHLDKVLELADAERLQYLAQLEREDAALAASVREFLAVRGSPGFASFLAAQHAAVELANSASLIGQRLGPYVIEAEIGRGGMGSVWRAHRADGQYEGQVAIKVLNAALVGQPAEQRFRREGSMLAELRHVHIAQLLDAGIASSGQAYLVLEYINGVRLDEYCAGKALGTKERVRLFLDVLSAVAHAHSHLIVHRDLKPANILVTPVGTVKLLDFGIAALLAADGNDNAARAPTVESGMAFTPEYATPEQLLNRPITTATDVYALGLVLFELLSGRHPRAGVGNSAVERVQALMDRDAPPLSASVTSPAIARKLRGDLDNIVAKALRREPTERYATAEALAEDLQRYLADEPVKARPDSLAYRASKFVGRHRTGVLAGTLSILGLIGLSLFAWLQMHEAQAQRDEAVLQRKRAETEARLVTQILDSVGESGKPLTLPDLLDRGVALLDSRFANDPSFQVHSLINMSGRFMDAGLTDRELATLNKAEDIARKVGDPLLLAEVECDSVETEIAAGRTDRAAARMRDGMAALARGRPPLDLTVDCLSARGSLADAQGDFNNAVGLIAQAVHLLAHAGPPLTEGVQYSGLLSHLAVLYQRQGDERASLDTSLEELRVLQQTGRLGSLHEFATRTNIARSLNSFGEVRDAREVLRALVRENQYGDSSIPIHPLLSGTYGEVLARLGETRTAVAWMDRGVADAQQAGSVGQELSVRVRRARALIQAACFTQAAADLAELQRRVLGHEQDFPTAFELLPLVRAEYLLASGNAAAAAAPIQSLLPKNAQQLPVSALSTALRAVHVAGRIALAQNQLGDAERLADEELMLAQRRARQAGASADVGDAYMQKAKVFLQEGRESPARDAARHASEILARSLGPANILALEANALAGATPVVGRSSAVAGSASPACRLDARP